MSIFKWIKKIAKNVDMLRIALLSFKVFIDSIADKIPSMFYCSNVLSCLIFVCVKKQFFLIEIHIKKFNKYEYPSISADTHEYP